jgi:hypothetical protein
MEQIENKIFTSIHSSLATVEDNGDCRVADQKQTGNRRIARLVCSLHMRGRGRMAVYRLFKNEPFEPEAIVSMTRVYADVCRTLGLSDTDHHETNVVAVKVIEFAQRGARDPMLLRDCVLDALRG